MTFPPPIVDYIHEKLGFDAYEGFRLWAIVGPMSLKNKFKTCETFIDAWNLNHPRNIILREVHAFDAVDRMIQIWQDRFQ